MTSAAMLASAVCIDLMEIKLTGQHMTLRSWRAGDAPSLAAACGEEDITRYTSVPTAYSLEVAGAWITEQLRRTAAGTALILAVVPARTSTPVGMAGLFGLTEIGGPRLGYWIVRAHRNRGLASGAAALLVAWASAHGHARVTLDVESHNDASRAVARRLGGSLRDRHTVRLDDGRTVELDRYILRR
jgi:8-oxo-dGTP diphosphatase